MAQEFHLRLITERAGGGDPIVRERRIETPELTIGRVADSDIVLTDLVIDPKHAKARFSGPGRVTIESVSGQPFEAGGRSVQRVDLDVASLPIVIFADYSLAFEPAPDGGATITVRHGDHAHYPTRSIFSLQSRVFGRRKMAWTFGAGIFVVCLLIPLIFAGVLSQMKIHPDQQWSSGPLSKSHAFLETDCKSCHTKSFVAVRDESCKSCHQASHDPAAEAKVLAKSRDGGSPFAALLIYDHGLAGVPAKEQAERLRKATPLPDGFGPKVTAIFQRTFNHPTDRCASCHIEHTKPGQKAKGGSPDAPLAHKPDLLPVNSCEDCHTGMKSRLGKTELIDTPSWDKHPMFRPRVMTNSVGPQAMFIRAALTARPQENNALKFPHDLHMDQTGGVARQAIALGAGAGYGAPLQCLSCHQRDKSTKGFVPVTMKKDCKACHSLAYARDGGVLQEFPHGDVAGTMSRAGGGGGGGSDRMRPGTIRPERFGSIAAPSAVSGSPFREGGACFECHTVLWTGAGMPDLREVKLTAGYMPRGVLDHSIYAHDGPLPKAGTSERREIDSGKGYKCADCHAAQSSKVSADVLMPDKGTCVDCHAASVSKPKAIKAKTECAECHSFHTPGKATAKPGQPSLETLRWTAAPTRKPAA